MFEYDWSALDADATLAAAIDNEHTVTTGEIHRLKLAAHWADLHPGEAVDPTGLPGRERPVLLGGDGTPEVGSFAAADFGPVLGLTAGSAARLIADALDLRHRLPRSWAAVQAGQGAAFHARRIAYATRKLTQTQTADVDARIAPKLGAVPYGRLDTLLQAYIYDADPDGADAEAEHAARDRFVRLGRTTEHGLRVMVAKMSAGDAAWGHALITRLADILQREGDPDTLDARRSKALGILITQPAEALHLLHTHQDHDPDDPEPPSDEDREPEPEEPTDAATGLHPESVQGPTSDPLSNDDDEAGGLAASFDKHSTRPVRIVPPPFDPVKARPRAVVYVHFSQAALGSGRGVARVEDIGPVLLTRLRGLLGDRCHVQLKPVIDLNDTPAPVDAYEIPDPIAEHVRLRHPSDVFPYAATTSRRTDLDHAVAYLPIDKGGPPGQTSVDGLGPLARHSHNVRTHGRWRMRHPDPDTWVWRSPQGYILLVNPTGSHRLGRSDYAQRIWRAANAPPRNSEQTSRAEQITRSLLDACASAG